jgi:hypothetical protein
VFLGIRTGKSWNVQALSVSKSLFKRVALSQKEELWYVSAQPMARVKRMEINKRRLVLISGRAFHLPLNINISSAASMATGKCGFGFQRYKRIWCVSATGAKAHHLELNWQSLACKTQRSNHWVTAASLRVSHGQPRALF